MEDVASKSSSASHVFRGSVDGGVDPNLLEMMDLSLQDLQLLSALDEEGPLAPANSLESLVEDSHAGPSEATSLPWSWRSSFCASDNAGESMQPALVRGERSISMTTSEEAKAQRPPVPCFGGFAGLCRDPDGRLPCCSRLRGLLQLRPRPCPGQDGGTPAG
ncbi:hypothetical protein MTO96_015937 [Rhipicephalus appendiculatus]